MHRDGYYSTGEFAKKANISVRTIRYYDQQNILKPSLTTEAGVRFYTDADFTRLQQVLLFKYLGFSLDDIRDMTIGDSDYNILKNSLELQRKLIQDKISQMQMVQKAIEDTADAIDREKSIDWSNMLSLIHLTNMENTLKSQYQNAGNISARINLHTMYSVNKQGWFEWIYEQSFDAMGPDLKNIKILELGCGDGSIWTKNIGSLAQEGKKRRVEIEVTDISEGMIRDAQNNIKEATKSWTDRDINVSFKYKNIACEKIKVKDNTYDLVIANHVLFYCEDLELVLKEIKRVLKPNGRLVCSTYGKGHMQEISHLVNQFDKRIVLAADNLFEKFGLDNGAEELKKHFSFVDKKMYEDYLLVDKAEPLVEYILSCHGNQNQYLLDRYGDFKTFVGRKLKKPMRITKEAGLFICKK